jgi:phosphoglycolate phosphatase-like HAD superfamily hydrolase
VDVKTTAYENLFVPFGTFVAKKVKKHHEEFGGVSRYEKIPLYLDWAGESASPEKTDQYCQKFSEMVIDKVVSSAWVPGVREYIDEHYKRQTFILITATPQIEIIEILTQLNLKHCFKKIFGAPRKKEEAIKIVLKETSLSSENALVVGDSKTDYEAAKVNEVDFILRRTPINKALQSIPKLLHFDNLKNE